MTRSELVRQLAARFPNLTQTDAEEAVTTILEALRSTLVAGRRAEIRGFGGFSVRDLAPRTVRNPKTGETFAVSSRRYPHFKAGKDLRERANQITPNID